jgi:alpha-beta hydrolase superfamily lysophospholipase
MTSTTSPARLTRTPAEGVTVRGTVVVLGGRGETPEVYERFADRIAVDGYRVVAFGDSRRDPDAVLAEAAAELDGTAAGPRVVVSSDSGVALAWRGIADGRLGATGVVSAGALTAAGSSPVDAAGEIEARTACPVHRGRLVRDGVLSGGELQGEQASDEVDVELATRILVPALALHGDCDVVSHPDDAFAVYDALPDARLFALDEGLHDVLNDLTHRQVAAQIVQFLERLRTPNQGLRAVPQREYASLCS